MPVAVFTVGCLFKTDKFNWNTMLNMLLVTVGVAIASYGAPGAALSWLRGLLACWAGWLANVVSILWTTPLLPLPACPAANSPRRSIYSRPPALSTPPRSPPNPAGELNFNIVGVMFQLGSIFSESIRLVMVQILLQVGFAPCCTAAVHVPAAVANCFAALVLNHCGLVAPRRGVHSLVQALQQYRLLWRHGAWCAAQMLRNVCFCLGLGPPAVAAPS